MRVCLALRASCLGSLQTSPEIVPRWVRIRSFPCARAQSCLLASARGASNRQSSGARQSSSARRALQSCRHQLPAPHHPPLSSRAEAPGHPSPVCESAPAATTPRMLRRGILHSYACHLSTPHRPPLSSRVPTGARRSLQSCRHQLPAPHHPPLSSRGRPTFAAPSTPQAPHTARVPTF